MKTFTLQDIINTNPCECYAVDDYRLTRRLWGDRETATVAELLRAELVPVADRLWLFFALKALDQHQECVFRARLAFFAADIYERYYPDDSRVRECAQAWKDAADGKDVDLSAALDAARAAAWSAMWAATKARVAAWSAMWAATKARVAAWAETLDIFVGWLLEIIEAQP